MDREYEAVVLGAVDHEALLLQLGQGVKTTEGVFVAQLLHSEVKQEVCI